MSEQQTVSASPPPDWPTCVTEGCIGVRLDGHDACLGHVGPAAHKRYLAGLQSGGLVDLRGTPISAELLDGILAVTTTENGSAMLGTARFSQAQFLGDARFDRARFTGEAWFDGARFSGEAWFNGAQFSADAVLEGVQFTGNAWFREARFSGNAGFGGAWFSEGARFAEARFSGDAWFRGARFSGNAGFRGSRFLGDAWFGEAEFFGDAWFGEAEFFGDAWFRGARFSGAARFGGAQFSADALFNGAQFSADAIFNGAQFAQAEQFGPLLVAARLVLDRARFAAAVLIDAATPYLSCVASTFQQGVTLRGRYAEIVLDVSVFAQPSTLAYAEDAFRRTAGDQTGEGSWFDETPLGATGRSPRPRLLSLRRVDVSTLVLNGVDLSFCLFHSSQHLDQLRIEGRNLFGTTPVGWKWGRVGGQGPPLWRWTKRWTIVEEHMWRAARPLPSGPPGRRHPHGRLHPQLQDWTPPTPTMLDEVERSSGQRVGGTGGPEQIAPLYRALRKAQEDLKDEPGAADFYYGEMEMRRNNAHTPWAERVILWLYWLISGYGLRGLRALAWLVAVVVGLAGVLQIIGFNGGDPGFRDALIYAAQSTISIASSNRVLTDHVSWAGEVLRIVLRLVGPVLLGLALLSIRNRVKR